MSSTATKPVKKVYQCPQLCVYGDIREITQQHSARQGMVDNMFVTFLKT